MSWGYSARKTVTDAVVYSRYFNQAEAKYESPLRSLRKKASCGCWQSLPWLKVWRFEYGGLFGMA